MQDTVRMQRQLWRTLMIQRIHKLQNAQYTHADTEIAQDKENAQRYR